MMTTSSQMSSTRSSWWLENNTVDAVAGDLGEQLGQGGDGERVESGERLVEDEQLWLVDQRGDQLDALLVAVRQGVEPVPRPVGARPSRSSHVSTLRSTSAALRPQSRPR